MKLHGRLQKCRDPVGVLPVPGWVGGGQSHTEATSPAVLQISPPDHHTPPRLALKSNGITKRNRREPPRSSGTRGGTSEALNRGREMKRTLFFWCCFSQQCGAETPHFRTESSRGRCRNEKEREGFGVTAPSFSQPLVSVTSDRSSGPSQQCPARSHRGDDLTSVASGRRLERSGAPDPRGGAPPTPHTLSESETTPPGAAQTQRSGCYQGSADSQPAPQTLLACVDGSRPPPAPHFTPTPTGGSQTHPLAS